MRVRSVCFVVFFFNDTATTEIYTLSLHDALPISRGIGRTVVSSSFTGRRRWDGMPLPYWTHTRSIDRKSTRLNSSHQIISYAVFCLKKKKKKIIKNYRRQRTLSVSGSPTSPITYC